MYQRHHVILTSQNQWTNHYADIHGKWSHWLILYVVDYLLKEDEDVYDIL